MNMGQLMFYSANPVFQRKPKILQSPAHVPSIQVPQEGALSLNSMVSTGSDPRSLAHAFTIALCVWHTSEAAASVPCAVAVCVYVNKHGNCGPHLDRKQMQHLPDHFGPGPVNSVLQQVVQSCVDCSYQPKVLLSALQTHAGGGEVVRGRRSQNPQNGHTLDGPRVLTPPLCLWEQSEQTGACAWSNCRRPPARPSSSASWRPCAATCSATTFSAASRSATTPLTTGPSQVTPASEPPPPRRPPPPFHW